MKGFHFPQAEITLTAGNPGSALILRSGRILHTLSSAVVGGGFNRARIIVNRHVDKDYHVRDAAADLIAFARHHGIGEDFIGLMTAVYLEDARAATCVEKDLTVTAVATVGLGNATAAGLTKPALLRPGTINLITLIDGCLTPAAMVNAVVTMTEAKTAVLSTEGVRTGSGHAATGTSTDALVVACTERGGRDPTPGPPRRWVGASPTACGRL